MKHHAHHRHCMMRHYLEDESDEKSQSNVCRLATSSNQANRRRKIAAEDYFNSADYGVL